MVTGNDQPLPGKDGKLLTPFPCPEAEFAKQVYKRRGAPGYCVAWQVGQQEWQSKTDQSGCSTDYRLDFITDSAVCGIEKNIKPAVGITKGEPEERDHDGYAEEITCLP